jgi:serine/threonine protein kinase
VSFRFPPTSDPLEDKITSTRNGQDEVLSSVSQFASILSQTGIHGPRHLQAHNLTRQAVRIGRGTQFTVFRRLPDLVIGEAEDVVIKRVNVALSRDESNAKSFAASPEYRQQLRALELELLSLCNPRLRGHRNIVHLVAWGYDYPIPDTPVPILFVEAALLPLSDFLKPENRELLGNQPDDVKYQLALDTVAGIEALHSLSIVHGDIKPDNILVFRQTAGGGGKVPFCAKISDFGVCLNLETRQSSLVIEDYRGTPGWLPPEIQDEDHRWTSRQKFAPEVMLRFDSYSLGLLILSVFVSDGQLVDLEVDGEEPVEAAIDLLRGQTSLVSALRMQLGKALRAFLAIDPWERALPSPDLLKTDTPAFASWYGHAVHIYSSSIDW